MIEERFVRDLVARIGARSPAQLNAPYESDAEVVRVGPLLLALTTDAVAEEARLFKDPETLGWLATIASLSDLAAVGARPVGVLLCLAGPLDDPAFTERFAAGVRGCLEAHGAGLLGGDSNAAPTLLAATTGLGVIERDAPIGRTGARPDDGVYFVGEVGSGNLAALAAMVAGPAGAEAAYRPTLPFEPWLAVCGRASACVDTSDGLLAAARAILLASGVGLRLDLGRVPFAAPVRRTATDLGLPILAFAAGVVGEYGLLLTVPAAEVPAFDEACREVGLRIARIGTATEAARVEVIDGARTRTFDADELAALAEARDPASLLRRIG